VRVRRAQIDQQLEEIQDRRQPLLYARLPALVLIVA
jgi:hypothetical protein